MLQEDLCNISKPKSCQIEITKKNQGNNSFNSLLITLVFLLISCKDDILQNTNILLCDLCLTNFVDYFLFLFIFLPCFFYLMYVEKGKSASY